ncbi:hypothetical protein MUN78_07130 [Leucobacter allii]|uniref:Uncharacterized protein n=1 Tax=Leucobacter allii TaxID=2932247 RepID=A0ABY4FQN1_9MICO|nr:hypothetical protein [Leucobacter allii]UOQ58590.1 hypothetical protein MUN78_07130 [Leucobacter allii]
MPITHLPETRRRRGQYGWYPAAEAAWALIVIVIIFSPLLGLLPTVALAVLGAPGAFFASVRLVAAFASMTAGAR